MSTTTGTTEPTATAAAATIAELRATTIDNVSTASTLTVDMVSTTTDTASSCLCPKCGEAVDISPHHAMSSDAETLLRQARRQIQDLEAQVVLLDQKAAAAIDRWADYEDELTQLRRQLSQTKPTKSTPPTIVPPPRPSASAPAPPLTPASPTRTSFLPTGAANRLSALLTPRSAKSTPNLKAAAVAAPPPPPPMPTGMPTPPPSATNQAYPHHHASTSSLSSSAMASPSPRTPKTPYSGSFPFLGKSQPPSSHEEEPMPTTKDLLAALTREQDLRRAAEGQLRDTSREVEELSVSLFEQANEMVAEERRARARLEARVAVLEQRDTDKRRRLERLEQAMDRIERVRALLGEVAASTTAKPEPKVAVAAAATEATATEEEPVPGQQGVLVAVVA